MEMLKAMTIDGNKWKKYRQHRTYNRKRNSHIKLSALFLRMKLMKITDEPTIFEIEFPFIWAYGHVRAHSSK